MSSLSPPMIMRAIRVALAGQGFAVDLFEGGYDAYRLDALNPAGEFFWLERENGLPISEALADVLLGLAPRRETPLLARDPR